MMKHWGSQDPSEPEIIRPGETNLREMEGGWREQLGDFETSTHHIYVRRIGPFGLIAFYLMTGVMVALLFAFTVSAFLILLPVAMVLVAGIFIVSWLRRPSHGHW
ncbi:MAG: hypothetical protein FWD08_07770 [Alphaproteobacteria bacterium]|nr:hypothetical protein [Alphaproteobacteria bacterium]